MTQQLLVAPGRPGAYQKIGDALAAAEAEAVVTVAAGTYYEALFVTDKTVSVVAEQGPGTVVVDVSSSEYAAIACTRARVLLRDLTLLAGKGPAVYANEQSRVTVENCRLTAAGEVVVSLVGGTAYAITRSEVTGAAGTGLLADAAEGTVDACRFDGAPGNGIFVRTAGSLLLRDSAVTNVGAAVTHIGGAGTGVGGGGIVVTGSAEVTVERGHLTAGVVLGGTSRARLTNVTVPAVTVAPGAKAVLDNCADEHNKQVRARKPGTQDSAKRPPALYAAIALLAPAVFLWFAAAVGCVRVIMRSEGDAVFLIWIIFVFLGLICVLLAFMCLVAMLLAWTGEPAHQWHLAAGVTAGLCLITVVNLLVRGTIDYNPTQIGPIVVGVLAVISLVLVNTKPVVRWLAAAKARQAQRPAATS